MPRSNIMLCSPYNRDKVEKWLAWDGCVYVQPKLNGERCRAQHTTGKDYTCGGTILYSSESNIIASVPHIEAQLAQLSQRFHSFHLDGELYVHGMPKQTIRSLVGRTRNLHPDHHLINYHIFDIVQPEREQHARYDTLITALAPELVDLPSIKIVRAIRATSIDEVDAFLVECMTDGYEGIVIRKATSKWVAKRSTEVLKWKPRGKDTYKIIDICEEVSIHGVPKNALGAFTCVANDTPEIFNVGSGSLLTRANREAFWKVRDALIGRQLIVKYPELTNRGIPSQPVAIDII